MTSPKPTRNAESQAIALNWAHETDVRQVLADEAIVQYAADRVYLSFGQVQMPPDAAFDGRVDAITVEPVARLVFTTASFHKLRALLNSVGDQIPRPESPKGEGQR